MHQHIRGKGIYSVVADQLRIADAPTALQSNDKVGYAVRERFVRAIEQASTSGRYEPECAITILVLKPKYSTRPAALMNLIDGSCDEALDGPLRSLIERGSDPTEFYSGSAVLEQTNAGPRLTRCQHMTVTTSYPSRTTRTRTTHAGFELAPLAPRSAKRPSVSVVVRPCLASPSKGSKTESSLTVNDEWSASMAEELVPRACHEQNTGSRKCSGSRNAPVRGIRHRPIVGTPRP